MAHGVGAAQAARALPGSLAACLGVRALLGDAGDRCVGDAGRGRRPGRIEPGPATRAARVARPSQTLSGRASTRGSQGPGETPRRRGPDGAAGPLSSHLSWEFCSGRAPCARQPVAKPVGPAEQLGLPQRGPASVRSWTSRGLTDRRAIPQPRPCPGQPMGPQGRVRAWTDSGPVSQQLLRLRVVGAPGATPR